MKKQVLAAATLGIALSAPSYANLVFNGGFEIGNLAGGDRTNYIYGWSTSGDVFAENTMTEFIHTGSFSAMFVEPEGGPGRVAQTLSTIAGQSYEFSYWLQNYRGISGALPNGTFRVTAGDFVYEHVNTLINPWTQFTFDFTASSNSALLEFMNFRDGFTLDDVSVIEIAPIPEPAPTALLGLGALALLLARARR